MNYSMSSTVSGPVFENEEMESDQELTWSTAMYDQFKTVLNLIDLLCQQGKIDPTEKFLSDLFPGLEPSSLETIPKSILQKVQKEGPVGLAVKPLDLHEVNVGSIPTGPTHGEERLQPHPWDVLKSTSRMSGRAPDQA